MSKDKDKTDLQNALQKPVITNPHMERIMAQSTGPEATLIVRRWYVSFLLTTLRTFGVVIGGIAMGFIFVVIIHYTGLEAWMDSMRSY